MVYLFNTLSFHDIELSWIRQLQEGLRSDWLDLFFIGWDKVDSVWFVFPALIVIITLFNRKEGLSLLLIFMASAIINAVLKECFALPRPCHIDPLVGLVQHSSYGFPSGASQTATIVLGASLAKCRSRVVKALACLFSLILCFSRLYLGVHFFSDLAGGIAVGMGLLVLYLKVFPLFVKQR